MVNARIEVWRFGGKKDFSLWKTRMLPHLSVLDLKDILEESLSPYASAIRNDEDEDVYMERLEHGTGKARNVLELMLRKEGTDRTRTYNIYLRALCVVDNPIEILNVLMGRVDDAMKVLGDMMTGKFCAPDAVTQVLAEEALDVLDRVMPENGLKPIVVTYNAVMRGLFKLRKGVDAMCVFDQMAKAGVDTAKRFWDDVIWPSGRHDAFLKGLCRFGSLSDACHFLYELADSGAVPNVVCHNIVIDECSRSGLRREAYQIIEEMRKNGQAPDAVTWRILDKLHDSRALAVEGE
ncbi:hypothetical protein IGI04_020208 [Brassica rapa subsp. trilocularis]|uniref:Pentacotripeptide-repeat region of PRORP domain-containing protein n=1 Tax=Brassica rapa subsp. trilocularis TaxID=1813537 RepID=A0ABQ7MI32_BRACM|nr:hypothetical protein IGI04_020208 [Brassica rapa subsp. trilocularis]